MGDRGPRVLSMVLALHHDRKLEEAPRATPA
jgi:hypothetical protein